MTLIVILTAIFNVSLLVLIAGAAWFLQKMITHLGAMAKEQAITNDYLKDLWMYYNTAAKEQADTNTKLDELTAFMKLTFNKDFAKKVEDVLRIKEDIPKTVMTLCDDGKYHDLPIDRDF